MPLFDARDSEVKSLIADIAAWLSERRATVRSRARTVGIPDSYLVQVYGGDFQDDGSIRYDQELRKVTPFAIGLSPYQPPLKDIVVGLMDSAAERLATKMAQIFGDGIRYMNSMAPAVYQALMEHPSFVTSRLDPETKKTGDRPIGWPPLETAMGLLYSSVLEYLTKIPSLDADDADVATTLSTVLVDFAASTEIEVQTRLVLGCIDAESTVMRGGPYLLRRLTAEELGALGSQVSFRLQTPPLWPPGLPSAFSLDTFADQRLVLQATSWTTKHMMFVGPQLAQKLIYALELLGFHPCGRGALMVPHPSWAWRGIGWGLQQMSLPTMPSGSRTIISEDQFREAVGLSGQMPDSSIRTPSSSQDVAIQRFGGALSKQDAMEALVDYVVALESLLLGGVAGPELKHRFALNGAVYLRQSGADRRSLYRDLAQIYDVRSALVHGTRRPNSKSDIPRLIGIASGAAREGILKALRSESWPTQSDFLASLLDDTP